MTKQEQTRFVHELMDNIRARIIADIELDKTPTNWDGHELRQLIADRVAVAAFTLKEQKARYREYQNTVLVNNL